MTRAAQQTKQDLLAVYTEAADQGWPTPSRLELGNRIRRSMETIIAAERLLVRDGAIVVARTVQGLRVQITATGRWTADNGSTEVSGRRTPSGKAVSRDRPNPRPCIRCRKIWTPPHRGQWSCPSCTNWAADQSGALI